MEYNNNYEYKACDLFAKDELTKIKETCNEYGYNLGSNRKKQADEFEIALKLKHFPNFDTK